MTRRRPSGETRATVPIPNEPMPEVVYAPGVLTIAKDELDRVIGEAFRRGHEAGLREPRTTKVRLKLTEYSARIALADALDPEPTSIRYYTIEITSDGPSIVRDGRPLIERDRSISTCVGYEPVTYDLLIEVEADPTS